MAERIVKVLVVEENGAMRRLVRTLIEGSPVSISECPDGAQVLAACAAVQPDWVVLDLDVAGIDAFDATRQIAAAYPHVRVLVLGEDDDVRLRNTAARAGAWGYVLKGNLIDLRRLLDPMARESNCNQGSGC